MADNLARFRALQTNSNPQMFNSDTTSGAIEGNAQAIEAQKAQIQAYLESVRKSQEQSQLNTPNVTVDGTTEAPSYDFETPVAGESAQMGNVPRVTQAFGNRSSVEAFSKGVNLGTDFGVKKGTPLALPPGEWEVMTTFSGAKEGQRGANSGSGNLVKVVNTKTGEMLAFEHLSGVGVRPGQTINGGTVIGLSGNTGNSTGPHASIPYQDAQGKYHDVMSSPYAQYIFGKTSGSTTGKGGGKLDDIKTKTLEYLAKIPGALDSGVKNVADYFVKSQNNPIGEFAAKGLSNMLLYNQDKQRSFPNSPYWGIKDANAIQDPTERQKALQTVAENAVMGLSASPKSIGGKYGLLDDAGALDQAMDILRNKQSTADMADEAEMTLRRLGEGYRVSDQNYLKLGEKLQKLFKDVGPGTEQPLTSKELSFQKMQEQMSKGLNSQESPLKKIELDTTTPVKPLSVEPVGGDLLAEAKKYKSAEEFAKRPSSKTYNLMLDQGVRGEEARIKFWEDATKGMDKTPVIDNLNPTGGVFVDYKPSDRVTAKLGDNITTLDKTMGGSPDDMITIYRGAPKSQKKINPGDFVTTSPEVARGYTGDGNVLEMKVRKGDILDDITEPGMGEETIFRPGADKQVAQGGLGDMATKPNAFQDILPSKSKPEAVKNIVKGGGNPLYHDTNADGVMGILDSGEIRPNQAPLSSLAGQGKRVSTTRNFDNYSRYHNSPYRFIIDEAKTGQKSIPDNRAEFESIFQKPVKLNSVGAIGIDTTNPAILQDIKSGKLESVLSKARERGISIQLFEGKVLPDKFSNRELQQLTKTEVSNLVNKSLSPSQGGLSDVIKKQLNKYKK